MVLVTNFFSLVPFVLYTIVAIMLAVIAVVSVYGPTIIIYQLIVPSTVQVTIIMVINSLLLTITIIVPLDREHVLQNETCRSTCPSRCRPHR
jgi:hypothetical protein